MATAVKRTRVRTVVPTTDSPAPAAGTNKKVSKEMRELAVKIHQTNLAKNAAGKDETKDRAKLYGLMEAAKLESFEANYQGKKGTIELDVTRTRSETVTVDIEQLWLALEREYTTDKDGEQVIDHAKVLAKFKACVKATASDVKEEAGQGTLVQCSSTKHGEWNSQVKPRKD